MEIKDFLKPVDLSKYSEDGNYRSSLMGMAIDIFKDENSFPDTDKVSIAILGVEEDRASINNEGCANAPDAVREQFYRLYKSNLQSSSIKIIDVGNIRRGHSIQDTYFALTKVLSELIKHNIVPIIIGGGQDLTCQQYLAYESFGYTINMVAVDNALDVGELETELNSRSYLNSIILHQPNFLFNYSNIGYQTYFVDAATIELMNKLYFDTYRLGHVRNKMEEVEPILRNADMLSFDVSCIRQSDAPGNGNATPNGFYGEEACQIARYAGLSEKISSIGFYEYNPRFENRNQTAQLVAQMIWYFIDGVCSRKKDYPGGSIGDYIKYRVPIKNREGEILFYKSNKTDRWWMEVPYPANKKVKYERHHLVPCSYTDYETACKDEMPDRWWQTYQKLI